MCIYIWICSTYVQSWYLSTKPFHIFAALEDPNAIVIPQEKTSEIAALLAQQVATPPRVLSWNIDGLDEVGGGPTTLKTDLDR